MFDSREPVAGPPDARPVVPPIDVWIDIPRLLRRPKGHVARPQPGIQASFRLPGQVFQWAPTTDGAWLALVRYTLETSDEQGATFTHYVPADLVTRRSPRATRQAKDGKR